MKRLIATVVGVMILLLVVIIGLLRATGAGDEVGDFVFGSASEPTPTATPRPAPTAKPTPSSSDIYFNLGNIVTGPNCQLGRPYSCRTSTGMVVFQATVGNNSRCAISSIVVHLSLLDGDGNVVKELSENLRSLSPQENDMISIFAPPPESLGWEMHDSHLTWQWNCN